MRKESELYLYQNVIVNLLFQNTHFGPLLDMGLGKTVSSLTAINKLMFEDFIISNVLIIAPKRVIESVWAQEALLWEHLQHLTFSRIHGSEKKRTDALKQKADIYLISRDNIAWLCELFDYKLPFDMLVVDESSSFKNHNSKRFKALRLSLPSFKRVVILTGTPAANGMINLWSQIYLLDRGERLGRTITQYREAFFYAAQQNGHIVYKYGCTKENSDRIMELINDITVSMEQKDYLKLPGRNDNIIYLDMPDKLKADYKEFERQKVLEIFSDSNATITAANSAALSTKLLQYANGAVYDEDKNYYEMHKLKLEALEEIMEEAQGNPVLVAYTFQSDMKRILQHFKKYNPRLLETDQDIQDWNAGKIEMLLSHPASAGHGLNLQEGGHIIVWFGNTWDLELELQLNRRLLRPGQKHVVSIHKLVIKGTMDENVIRAQRSKEKVQNSLMEAVKYRIDKYINK